MDRIIDGLYLGDIQGASSMALLKRNNITHILQVAAGFKPFFPGEFSYMVINVLDMPFENLIRHFKTAVDFIKSAIKGGGTVLVHCYAGISRSASVVIAYLMREHGLPMLDAMQYVRKRRAIIYPNPGFQRQLVEFEKHLVSYQQKVMKEYQERKKKRLIEQQQQIERDYRQKESEKAADPNKHQMYKTGISWAQQVALNSKGRQSSVIVDPKKSSQPADKTAAMQKLFNTGQLEDLNPMLSMKNNSTIRAQTEHIDYRKKDAQQKHVFASPEEQQKYQRVLSKEGYIVNNDQPKPLQLTHPLKLSGLATTMQSSYARDFSFKPILDSEKYKQSYISNTPGNDRKIQSFKEAPEQRSTTLFTQNELRASKQVMANSQQNFYQTQRSPKPAVEDLYLNRKTLQDKHQRVQHLEEKPPLASSKRIQSAIKVTDYDTQAGSKRIVPSTNMYAKADKPLINTYNGEQRNGNYIDIKRELLALRSPQNVKPAGLKIGGDKLNAIGSFDHRSLSQLRDAQQKKRGQ